MHLICLQFAYWIICFGFSGLVYSYLAISKVKEALYIAREAMKAMPQSAVALKLVGDVHAKSSSGREKVCITSHDKNVIYCLLRNV